MLLHHPALLLLLLLPRAGVMGNEQGRAKGAHATGAAAEEPERRIGRIDAATQRKVLQGVQYNSARARPGCVRVCAAADIAGMPQ